MAAVFLPTGSRTLRRGCPVPGAAAAEPGCACRGCWGERRPVRALLTGLPAPGRGGNGLPRVGNNGVILESATESASSSLIIFEEC